MTNGRSLTGRQVNELDADVGMRGVAHDLGACFVGSDVPGIEVRNRADLFGLEVDLAQRLRPHRVGQPISVAKKGLVDDELVVVVLVKAFKSSSVALNNVHPRSGIACKLD